MRDSDIRLAPGQKPLERAQCICRRHGLQSRGAVALLALLRRQAHGFPGTPVDRQRPPALRIPFDGRRIEERVGGGVVSHAGHPQQGGGRGEQHYEIQRQLACEPLQDNRPRNLRAQHRAHGDGIQLADRSGAQRRRRMDDSP